MANNKEEKKRDIQAELRQMTDPVAYRDNPQSGGYDKYIEGWDASKLQNADVNLSQYGDDSSAANYNNQSLRGGENQKYTGENTLNSQVAYNPNATLEGLDPNYKYGQAAQMANSQNANYIASRNDEIASALYNAGKTSIQDVNDFLSTQTGWDYSNANERANTVASVWKRLGQIAQQQGQKDQHKPEREELKGEKSDGKIYGKATADSGEPVEGIDTLTDANNIYNSLLASRQANLDILYNMSTDVIAASVANGINPYGEQAMVDYQRAYPQLRAEVQRKVKEIKGQDAINSITHGSADYVESEVETSKKLTESNKVTAASTYAENSQSVSSIINEINQELMSDQTAEEASATMDRIEGEVAKLKNRLQNLRQEANEVFKGDAPDYLVRAYINNKTQDINNQLSILADRYSMASNRYNQQWENEWKQKEYDLKERQVKLQEEQFEYNKQKSKIQNSEVKYQDGEWYTITYDDNGLPTISKGVVQQQYPGSGMKGAGLRNNNPGNITDQDFGNPIGKDEKGFAIFATPEDGFDALLEKVKYNQTNPNSRYYGDTILEYFNTYAPKYNRDGTPTGNDPDGRAAKCAAALGVSVNTKIADLDTLEFAKFIALTDSGYNYDTYGQFRNGATSSDGTSSVGNVEVDFDDIVVPDYVFKKEDGTTVDRDSEEGKQLALEYRKDYVEKNVGTLFARVELDGEGGKAYKMIANDTDIPLDYRQVIYNMVPTKMKDSDQQLAQLYSDIKRLWNLGYDKWEAGLIWYGIDVSKDKTGLAWPLIDQTRILSKELPDTYYGDLNSKLDRGDTEGAVRKVEYEALGGDGGAGNEAEREAIEKINKANQIIQKIKLLSDAKGLNSVGVIGGTVSKSLKNLFDEAEYVGLAADIENLLPDDYKSDENNTRTPVVNEPINNIIAKINALKNNELQRVNSYRSQLLLPTLTEEQLLKTELRADLYIEREKERKKQREMEEKYGKKINQAK